MRTTPKFDSERKRERERTQAALQKIPTPGRVIEGRMFLGKGGWMHVPLVERSLRRGDC